MAESLEPTTNAQGDKAARRAWYQLHVSTYVVLLLATAVLFFVNVPGQYVPHVGLSLAEEEFHGRRLVHERLEHGWPWTYLVRADRFLVDRPGETGYRSTAAWSFSEDFLQFAPAMLIADVVVALMAIIVVAALSERWRRQRSSVWQLRMTDLFGLTAIIALAIWFGLRTMRDYRRELAAMRKLGLHVEEDGHRLPQYPDFSRRTRSGPTWLRMAIGEERFPKWFDRLVYAELPEGDFEDLSAFKRLKAISIVEEPGPKFRSVSRLDQLEAIHIYVDSVYWEGADTQALDRELARYLPLFAELPKLWLFQAEGEGVGDRSTHVIAKFPRLRVLDLARSKITDAALFPLGHTGSLEELRLEATGITDAGLAHLAPLLNLHTLDLRLCKVTDAAFEHLRKLTRLQCLLLDSTWIQGSGLDKLASLNGLTFLSLSDGVDRTAISSLRKQLPELRVLVGGEEVR